MSLASASNRPLSQVEIEIEINRNMDLLEAATETYEEARTEQARAEIEYRLDLARAKMTVRASTIPEREARALLAVERQFTAYKIADAKLDAAKAAKETISDRLSALQTLLRSVARQT
jgi:hypothetical protein